MKTLLHSFPNRRQPGPTAPTCRPLPLFLLVALLASCAPAARADSAAAYLSYKYTDEAEHGAGPGFMWTWDLEYNFRVDARLSYVAFGDPDLDMVPLEAALAYQFVDEAYRPYVGVSAGYFLLSANRGDVDNDFGFQLFAGCETDIGIGLNGIELNLVAEINYLFLNPDVDGTFAESEGTGDDISLDGLGINIGLMTRF